MSDEVNQEVKQNENTECSKKASPQYVWFVARITAHIDTQMQVFRFLQSSRQYRIIWALHDKDVALSEDVGKEYTKADGTKGKYTLGEPKPAHYHLIIRVPRKITEKGMNERFAQYVHFQKCGDPVEAAFYLWHNSFKAKLSGKYLYDESIVKGDLDMYKDLTKSGRSEDAAHCIRAYRDALQACNGNHVAAVEKLVESGDMSTVKNIMSHAYFYKLFCTEGG